MQHRFAEEHSKVVSLQHHNKSLLTAANQASEVEKLRAEVRRLQPLEQERHQFDADLEAFRSLRVDVRELSVFRKYKTTIIHYMKLLPRTIE